eukprot:29797-Pelagococcus_subviridis.AAC.3
MAKFPEKTPRAVLSEAPSLFLARCDAPHAEGNMPKLTGLPEPTFTIPVDRCAPHPPRVSDPSRDARRARRAAPRTSRSGVLARRRPRGSSPRASSSSRRSSP